MLFSTLILKAKVKKPLSHNAVLSQFTLLYVGLHQGIGGLVFHSFYPKNLLLAFISTVT